MRDINDVDLMRGYTFRDGFVFIFKQDTIVVRNPQEADCMSPVLGKSKKSLEEHISYINKNEIHDAIIIADDIKFLKQCPTLKNISIIPSDTAGNDFDFSILYEMPEIKSLNCLTRYGIDEKLIGKVDYSKIKGIETLSVAVSRGDYNFDKIISLKSLWISGFKSKFGNLKDMFNSTQLEELTIISSKIRTLEGIERSNKINSLTLWYNRTLEDISGLCESAPSLKCLSVINCPQISDFSCLSKLKELEYLELMGKNSLPDLEFINKLPNLKVFSFSMNIVDGNLKPCLKISYVNCEKNRKHYNLKDKDLSKILPGND